MKIYNTLSREKEEFVPINKGEVKIYACGPTVYNYIHIGNARPICVFDVLRRYMEYIGYKVTYIQNFTDIDDKIINRAKEDNTDYLSVSQKYIEEYWKDSIGLNVKKAQVHPKATENINEIIEMISTLIDKGYAYKAPNGDVYFRMSSFKQYGKLSHQPMEDLKSGARIEVGEDKKDPMDFTLWKAAKPGEPTWKSPWGEGRPGWHIECSAMARRYLGETIDIHCGGQDLIFPHHENEIAQSECCNGELFARYWMHNGYINVDSRKMSKSLNNFFTVREVAGKYGYEPIRYLMISSHYRSPINYSTDIIEQCISALERLYNCKSNLKFKIDKCKEETKENDKIYFDFLENYKLKFKQAMDDDLNTADGLSVIFEMVKYINTNIIDSDVSLKVVDKAMSVFEELADVLGLLYNDQDSGQDDEINNLIKLREEARKAKNWAEADRIRNELAARNVIIEDTAQGTKWKIKK